MNILVTGANGHLGNNLCRALVARGHRVRASVRDRADPLRIAHLADLPNLELVDLEVRNAEQFDAVTRGMDVICHTATTYAFYTGDPKKDESIVLDSVEGIENAMRSAAKSSVRKVVLTSSIGALPLRAPGEAPATEADWNTDMRVPYFRAKTLGEQTAWTLARQLGVTLVTLLPGAIGGGGFARRTATTDFFESMMLGGMKMGAPAWSYPYVDVADVVSGHVLAAEGDASGRFILCPDKAPDLFDLSWVCHRLDPGIPPAPWRIPDFLTQFLPAADALSARLTGSPRSLTPALVGHMLGKQYSLSNQRAKAELGWQPRVPIEHSVADLLARLRELRGVEAASSTQVFATS